MGTHDDPDPRRTDDERHPARPEQTDEGYATGVDHKPDTPEEELEPDPHKHGRFSTGEEELADSPEKDVEGRFSDSDE
jgi:hypothetical protein